VSRSDPRPDAVVSDTTDEIVRLARELERAPDGCGVLVVGDRAGVDLGSVVVDHGRIVLAMAPGAGRSIDLPADSSRLAIGLRRGKVTTRDLRRALLHRAADALCVLAADGVGFDWRPHESRDYHARSSFAIVEVLATALGRGVPALAADAERRIVESRWIDDESARTSVAAFHGEGPLPLPIYVTGDPVLGITEVLDLGRTARDTLAAATPLDDESADLVLGAFDACSRAVAAWSAGGVLFAARLDGPSAIERMLAGWHAVSRRG
jgi:hypothetical protein